MKKELSTIIAILLVGTIMGCDPEPISSSWTNEPPVIDGYGDDWESAGFTFLDDIRGAVAAANDDSMLYLLIRYRDRELARKASVGGFTLWWGVGGDKRQDTGIRFPGVVSVDDIVERTGSMRNGQGGLAPNDPMEHGPEAGPAIHDREDIHGEMELVFGDLDSPVHISGEIAAASYRYYKGSFVYEFALPFSVVQGSGGESNLNNIPEISLHIAIGGISDEDRERLKAAMPDSPRRGHTGGMGGRGGGMGGRGDRMGGPGNGRMGQRTSPEEMFSSEELWFKVRVSEAPTNPEEPVE